VSAVAERYRAVLRQVGDAADLAGRDPADVTVVAVTKTVGVAEISMAVAAGMRDFGENRAPEFVGKQALFPHEQWHFIGTLQSNKVKQVVGRAALIHSIDSLHLLLAVDRRAVERSSRCCCRSECPARRRSTVCSSTRPRSACELRRISPGCASAV
jgi:uncharacterized pyridoxal phosphate-containing UPF0001 family protein